MFAPFFCHWYESVGVPEALTENVAGWPTETLRSAGSSVIVGGVLSVYWIR